MEAYFESLLVHGDEDGQKPTTPTVKDKVHDGDEDGDEYAMVILLRIGTG